MPWIKRGLIFEPPGNLDWMVSHAALPYALHIGGDLFRVYVSGRDSRGRSQIGYFDLDMCEPMRVSSISEQPVISLGPLGAFDDSGVTSAWIARHEGRLFQYYTGWSLGQTVPFYLFIGLALGDDGGSRFVKHSAAPIMGRSSVDPFLTASPCVLVEDGTWRMWYISGVGWRIENERPKHYYHIKYAESTDGMSWQGRGVTAINVRPGEYAFARPSVLRDGDGYRMWFSYRGSLYRIGYAESFDGMNWERSDDRVAIDVSEEGWDSEMIAYPHVFRHRGRLHMLYNGNGYGRAGVGLAMLDE